jgi:pimeloyl-ACP methyl ester carboxylesterase
MDAWAVGLVGLAAIALCAGPAWCQEAEAARSAGAPVHNIPAPDTGPGDRHVRRWLVLGVFPNPRDDTVAEGPDRVGYVTDFLASVGGEGGAALASDLAVPWRDAEGVERETLPRVVEAGRDGIVDLRAHFESLDEPGVENVVAYAFCYLRSDEDQVMQCLFGSDDSARVWVNGELVHDMWVPAGRGCTPRSDDFRLALNAGLNGVLVKVDQMSGGWSFVFESLTSEEAREALAPQVRFVLTAVGTEAATDADGGQVWRSRLQVALDRATDAFAGTEVQVTVTDSDGGRVAHEEGAIGGDLTVETPPGAYAVRVEAPDFYGRTLTGETGLFADADPRALVDGVIAEARELASRPDRTAYAGWFEYLAGRAEEAMRAAEGVSSEAGLRALQLLQWNEKAAADRDAFLGMRGTQEWAYCSEVDGSGQPFAIRIPQDYDPARAWPLDVYLHGMGMTHEMTWGEEYTEPFFELRVLGRARAGGFGGLSGVDVLEAIDYVTEHWNIDRDRIHLKGGSMGGYGTFAIATRHPDLFATARPECGGGADMPVANMLHVPTYCIHSDDDWVVVVSMARTAARRIEEAGGTAVMDETTGLGHGVWEYREGHERGRRWAEGHTRAQDVRWVHYTALDGAARSAYWTEIVEWGPEHMPAMIDARLGEDNTLYLALDNVATAKIDLAGSPAELGRPMMLVADRRIVASLEPPLPEALYLCAEEDTWAVSPQPPPVLPYRLHYPGGASSLYAGEPLMIVWGTQGDDELDARMESLVDVMQRSCWPNWPGDEGGAEPPMWLTLFGRIPAKPDDEVTEDDIEARNLVLLGDATQNSVVARIADRLPVRVAHGRVIASDGRKWDYAGRALNLTFYNPLAPQRLVCWFASADPSFYRPDTPFARRLRGAPAPDFLLGDTAGRQLVAARCFSSRWEWAAGYDESPLLTVPACSVGGLSGWLASQMRRATGADFAFLEGGPAAGPAWQPGVSRKADLRATVYGTALATMELTGAELVRAAREFGDPTNGASSGFVPVPRVANVEPCRTYRVVLLPWGISDYASTTRTNPPSLRVLDLWLADVIGD